MLVISVNVTVIIIYLNYDITFGFWYCDINMVRRMINVSFQVLISKFIIGNR